MNLNNTVRWSPSQGYLVSPTVFGLIDDLPPMIYIGHPFLGKGCPIMYRVSFFIYLLALVTLTDERGHSRSSALLCCWPISWRVHDRDRVGHNNEICQAYEYKRRGGPHRVEQYSPNLDEEDLTYTADYIECSQ